MNFFEKLSKVAQCNRSLVCVGLDPDLQKLPSHLPKTKEGMLKFNCRIVDTTCEWVSAYKPQAAFYAGQNCDEVLRDTISYIHEKTQVPVILDVKRGDIGSTAELYACEAFERYNADAVTVNPYMGLDAVKPFLDHGDKGVFILCRTSNPHSGDLQNLKCDGIPLYEHVAKLVRDHWNYNNNAALVVGATYPDELQKLRFLCPQLPFLVPGVGAQGGDVEKVVALGCTPGGHDIIVNSSRGIIYAGKGEDFAAKAGEAARQLRDQINSFRC